MQGASWTTSSKGLQTTAHGTQFLVLLHRSGVILSIAERGMSSDIGEQPAWFSGVVHICDQVATAAT